MTLMELRNLVATLTAHTHDVLDVALLLDAGGTEDQVHALRRGWKRLGSGIFLVADREVDDVVRAEVARALAGDESVLSGAVVARWFGLRWIPDRLTHALALCPPERRRRTADFVTIRRTADLATMKTGCHEGMVVAPLPRVVIDTARQVSELRGVPAEQKLRDVRGIVLGAVADGRCTVEELREVLGHGAIAHSALARRACLDAERGAFSPPEAEIVDDLMGYGVTFYCNVEVWVDGRFLGLVDIWLVGTGVGYESDSRERHEAPDLLDRTLVRSKGFRDAGAALEHITPNRYRAAPQTALEGLFATVRSRVAAGLGDPPGLELRNARGPMLKGSGPQPYVVIRPARSA